MSEASATHEFQYSSAQHQAETAVSGMWLFLATEVLFFGALFLAWIYARHWDEPGFDYGAQQTSLVIGTANTLILITSSLVYSVGIAFIMMGNSRRLIQCCAIAWLLGAAFLILKFGVEWRDDFARHLFPGTSFGIHGPLRGGAQTFFVFYFFGTAIHGLHMVVGLVLVGWVIFRARRLNFSASYFTPAFVVGLYWSFVDMVWIILYPLIYLVGRGT
ncbi:MAG TPA: cytochrome c oxidase subunit 3 [Methylocella sp.]|nr:cytochrome c oxidase subunit 3 [Methylocella sp.]